MPLLGMGWVSWGMVSHERLIDPPISSFTDQAAPKLLFVLWDVWAILQEGKPVPAQTTRFLEESTEKMILFSPGHFLNDLIFFFFGC